MKRTKQITGMLLSLILILGIFPPIAVHAGGNVIIYVSSSSVNVGDTVKVTAKATGPNGEDANAKLEFQYDSGKLSFVSCSDANYSGGDGTVVANGNTVSITLKATTSGTASVTASGSGGVSSSDSSVSFGDLTAGGTKLTVNNAAGGNAGQENNEDNANKSEDNSLASLKISPGTLSPAFQYSVTDYTAAVGDDVTSITVDAKTSNDKAAVESITGHESLKPGQNTVSIVVKAENGVTATYKIVVTRGGGETGETSQPEEQPEEPEENKPEGQEGITINGHPFDLGATIPEDVIPQDFTKTTITCQGQQVEGLQFGKAPLMLVYLTTPSTEVKNTLAVYDEASGSIYPFRRVAVGEKYIILLNPPAETGLAQTYTQSAATVEGFENVPVFVTAGANSQGTGDAVNPDAGEAANPDTGEAANPDTANPDTGEAASSEAKEEEFSLVYGVSNFGNKGWYRYDTKEGLFQRYVPAAAVQETPQESESAESSVEMQGLQKAYKDLEEKFEKKKEVSRKTTAVMIFFMVVLLIVIVNLLLRGRQRDWEEEDFSYEEKPKKKTRKQISKENDWEDEFPARKTRKKPKKNSYEEDDWEDEPPKEKSPKEKSPKVRKRALKEDDWEDGIPREKSSKMRKRTLKGNDWEDDIPKEKPKAETKVSQDTKPMVKPEISPKLEHTEEKKETIPEDDFEVIDLEDL